MHYHHTDQRFHKKKEKKNGTAISITFEVSLIHTDPINHEVRSTEETNDDENMN